MSPTSYQLLYSAIRKMAEKEGFEPPRLLHPVGFQDRSLQPDLGISPFISWWTQQDSNLRPTGYEPGALTNWATGPSYQMVAAEGLEPPTSRVWTERYSQLSYTAINIYKKWWIQWGSNPRPPACKTGALPAELWTHDEYWCLRPESNRHGIATTGF